MANTSFQNILNELKSKKYHPVYFLYGDEPFFIDLITNFIENNVLSPEEKEFNQTILYGKDVEPLALISEARRYPVMSERTVVIVKEAQDISHFDAFQSYLDTPSPSTILVFAYKKEKIDGRQKIFKTIIKQAVCLQSKKLYENQIPAWITDYLSAKGYKIEPKASLLLTEFLGQELSKIANALDKLCIICPAGSTINEEIIEKNIGVSKEFNVFEFQAALSEKNSLKSFRIVNYFKDNEKKYHPIMVISSLFRYFTQLMIYQRVKSKGKMECSKAMGINPYFYKDYEKAGYYYSMGSLVKIISLLREYDLKSKGLGATGNTTNGILTELTYKILMAG